MGIPLVRCSIANELIVVDNGVEALKYFFGECGSGRCSIEDLPQVVLLDLNLPKINGFEVLRHLRAEGKTKLIPIVVFTSSNEEKDILTSYLLRANSFIRKPVKFDDYREAIRVLGLYWLVMNQATTNGIR